MLTDVSLRRAGFDAAVERPNIAKSARKASYDYLNVILIMQVR